MKDRRRRRRFPRSPRKQPPPEHGIRVQSVGTTWWGERWVEALIRLGAGYAARLRRGIIYARQGRVHDLTVAGGVVAAFVTGSRREPYRVLLALRPLPDRTWREAIRVMAGRARFAAELLGGEMPRAIDETFKASRASLFPTRADDLRTECSCPDWANPCKHVAAVHYVLGEAFDRDPFLLFELRGRPKDAVLRALRELRAEAGAPALPARERAAASAPEPAPAPHRPDRLGPAEPASYDLFVQPVDDLRFRIVTPSTEGAVLRHLGVPPAWSLDRTFADLVQPAVVRAARKAREIALAAQPESPSPRKAGTRAAEPATRSAEP